MKLAPRVMIYIVYTRAHNSQSLWFDQEDTSPEEPFILQTLPKPSVNPSLFALVSVTTEKWKWKWSHSVVPDSLRPHGLQPTRLLPPWDFPGKSTGVGCHFLFQKIYPTQGSNLGLPHCRQTLPSEPPGKWPLSYPYNKGHNLDFWSCHQLPAWHINGESPMCHDWGSQGWVSSEGQMSRATILGQHLGIDLAFLFRRSRTWAILSSTISIWGKWILTKLEEWVSWGKNHLMYSQCAVVMRSI